MSNIKYTITKFDKELKLLVVTFDDGGWAEIRLTNPLPKDLAELEDVIKRFAAPKEAIEAQLSPDADLSYIDSLIGIENECERFSLITVPESKEMDPEEEERLQMWEQINFERKIGEALVRFGIVETNPAMMPSTTL